MKNKQTIDMVDINDLMPANHTRTRRTIAEFYDAVAGTRPSATVNDHRQPRDATTLRVHELFGMHGSSVNSVRVGFVHADAGRNSTHFCTVVLMDKVKTYNLEICPDEPVRIFDDERLNTLANNLFAAFNAVYRGGDSQQPFFDNLKLYRELTGFDVREATVDGLRFATDVRCTSHPLTRALWLLTDSDADGERLTIAANHARRIMFPELNELRTVGDIVPQLPSDFTVIFASSDFLAMHDEDDEDILFKFVNDEPQLINVGSNKNVFCATSWASIERMWAYSSQVFQELYRQIDVVNELTGDDVEF